MIKSKNITMLSIAVLVVLLGVNAKIGYSKITELETKCDLFDCYTYLQIDNPIKEEFIDNKYSVDLVKKDSSEPLLKADLNIPKYTKGIEKMDIEIINETTFKVTGKIKGATNNYWGLTIFDDDSFKNSTWWNSSWSLCRNITFNSDLVDEDLQNFKVLLTLNSSRIDYAETQNYGQDLRIINASCNQGGHMVEHEIDFWNESGTSWVWFNANISNEYNYTYSYYYGNPSAVDGQQPDALWDAPRYDAVLHDSLLDTSGEGEDFTLNNGAFIDDSCYIHNCSHFDGTNDASVNDDLWDITPNNMTICWWFSPDLTWNYTAGTNEFMIGKDNILNDDRFSTQLRADSGAIRFTIESFASGNSNIEGTTTQFDSGVWYQVCTIWGTSKGGELWVNGEMEDSDPAYLLLMDDGSEEDMVLGDIRITVNPFDGRLDNFIFMDFEASDGWVETLFLSETDMLLVYSGEEEQPVTTTTQPATTSTTQPATTSTTMPETTSSSTSTIPVLQIIDWFCQNDNQLIRNYTYLNTTNTTPYYVSVYNATVCEYNCTETIFGTRCNWSPSFNGFLALVVILGILVLISISKILLGGLGIK